MASIDVVVPCYNYGRFLAQCVNSVLRQGDVDARVLIIDDTSSDDTPEVAAKLAQGDRRVSYRRHPVNIGHISTYNEGIEWVSADYFLLLSADDYLLPGALGRAVGLMERKASVGFVFGRAFMLGDGRQPERVRPLELHLAPRDEAILTSREFIALAGAKNIVPTPTAVVRSSLQKAVGGYRHELPHSGDMEMWLRLAARASVGYVDADQAIYRQHAANMSRHYSTTMLPDLEQRKTALESFVRDSAPYLPDIGDLHEKLRLDLARQAVSSASMAFNSGEAELSGRLLEVSRGLHPGIVNTAPWWRMKLKRGIGTKAWRAVDGVRQAVRPAYRNSG